jgi:hypothetical protein
MWRVGDSDGGKGLRRGGKPRLGGPAGLGGRPRSGGSLPGGTGGFVISDPP